MTKNLKLKRTIKKLDEYEFVNEFEYNTFLD